MQRRPTVSARTTRGRFLARLEVLNRRADFLKQRIADYDGKDASRDKSEYAAIVWAIHVIEECPLEAMRIIKFYEPSKEERKETN